MRCVEYGIFAIKEHVADSGCFACQLVCTLKGGTFNTIGTCNRKQIVTNSMKFCLPFIRQPSQYCRSGFVWPQYDVAVSIWKYLLTNIKIGLSWFIMEIPHLKRRSLYWKLSYFSHSYTSEPKPWFHIKMCYQFREYHSGNMKVAISSYLVQFGFPILVRSYLYIESVTGLLTSTYLTAQSPLVYSIHGTH